MSSPTEPDHLLVTGAAAGIGREIAGAAARRGLRLTLADRDSEQLAELAEELASPPYRAGERCLPCVADVGTEAEVEAAFRQGEERFGALAGLVTSAAVERGGGLDGLAASEWDEVLRVNLRGTFLCCRAALRQMLPSGRGAIVCLSSPAARVALPGAAAYCASKGGVAALVRSLAVDYGPRGIRANALVPGPTETELMWANVAPERVGPMREQIAAEVPLGRIGTVEDVAAAALWLLSAEAAYVNGSELVCDGGVLAKAPVSA